MHSIRYHSFIIYIFDCPILVLGARLGITEHLDDNRNVYGLQLTEQDKADIKEILRFSNSESMVEIVGDCGAEYRTGKFTGATFGG